MEDIREISCPIMSCGGTLEARFKDKQGVQNQTVMCSECNKPFDMSRKDWTDTPDDEVFYELTFE